MRQKLIVLLFVFIFIILILGAAVLYDRFGSHMDTDMLAGTHSNAAVQTAPAAPDFTVQDRNGNDVRLSDYLGTPVVINFWATWCGYCIQEMPDFEKAWQEYGDQVAFLMINQTDGMQETVKSATAHADSAGYTFPIYFDTQMEAAIAYNVTSIPATYFIGADGTLVTKSKGMMDYETLCRSLSLILPQE